MKLPYYPVNSLKIVTTFQLPNFHTSGSGSVVIKFMALILRISRFLCNIKHFVPRTEER